jgi:hypothetical protein
MRLFSAIAGNGSNTLCPWLKSDSWLTKHRLEASVACKHAADTAASAAKLWLSEIPSASISASTLPLFSWLLLLRV